jgi:hypothetical protein
VIIFITQWQMACILHSGTVSHWPRPPLSKSTSFPIPYLLKNENQIQEAPFNLVFNALSTSTIHSLPKRGAYKEMAAMAASKVLRFYILNKIVHIHFDRIVDILVQSPRRHEQFEKVHYRKAYNANNK